MGVWSRYGRKSFPKPYHFTVLFSSYMVYAPETGSCKIESCEMAIGMPVSCVIEFLEAEQPLMLVDYQTWVKQLGIYHISTLSFTICDHIQHQIKYFKPSRYFFTSIHDSILQLNNVKLNSCCLLNIFKITVLLFCVCFVVFFKIHDFQRYTIVQS